MGQLIRGRDRESVVRGWRYFINKILRYGALPGGPSSDSGHKIIIFLFLGVKEKQRSYNGRGGGARRPVLRGNAPKKTNASCAWARSADKTH